MTITKSDGTTESATKQEDNNTGGETQSDGKDHKNHSLLIGNWKNSSTPIAKDRYLYDGENYRDIYNYNLMAQTYKMKVEKIIWSSDTAGIMYGQYTEHQDTLGNPSSTIIGKYYAVSFKDLSESKCSFSGAYDGSTYSADTLEEAQLYFTAENGFFNTYTECIKTTDEI